MLMAVLKDVPTACSHLASRSRQESDYDPFDTEKLTKPQNCIDLTRGTRLIPAPSSFPAIICLLARTQTRHLSGMQLSRACRPRLIHARQGCLASITHPAIRSVVARATASTKGPTSAHALPDLPSDEALKDYEHPVDAEEVCGV